MIIEKIYIMCICRGIINLHKCIFVEAFQNILKIALLVSFRYQFAFKHVYFMIKYHIRIINDHI